MIIKKYNDFVNEEVGYIKTLLLSALLGLGISKVQAQEIKDDQKKLAIVDTIANYNKDPKGIDVLKMDLSKKVDNPDMFINNYLKLTKKNTFIVKPDFIKNLKLNVHLRDRSFDIKYNIVF